MTKSKFNVVAAGFAAAIIVLAGGTAVSAGQGTAIVRLQSSSPGTTQAGHLNINGTGLVRRLEATEPTFCERCPGLIERSDRSVSTSGRFLLARGRGVCRAEWDHCRYIHYRRLWSPWLGRWY